jgi:hypothetical protein
MAAAGVGIIGITGTNGNRQERGFGPFLFLPTAESLNGFVTFLFATTTGSGRQLCSPVCRVERCADFIELLLSYYARRTPLPPPSSMKREGLCYFSKPIARRFRPPTWIQTGDAAKPERRQ